MTDGTEPARPRAELIYERVREDAHDQLARPIQALGLSALFAGFTIGASALGSAVALYLLADAESASLIAGLLYPIGFVAVILGRAQFFTENTLYPVVASLEEPGRVRSTGRLWGIVFAANIVGALAFALLAADSPALPEQLREELAGLGEKTVAGGFSETFWSGVIAGWLLALVAWLVEASETAVGQVFVIWPLTAVIGLVPLDHCVATTVEVAGALFHGGVGLGEAAGWLATATLGNIVGGVMIVSVLMYGQVRST